MQKKAAAQTSERTRRSATKNKMAGGIASHEEEARAATEANKKGLRSDKFTLETNLCYVV